MTSHIQSLKRHDTYELICKTETDLEKELRVAEQGGRMREGTVRELGMDMHTLLYLK